MTPRPRTPRSSAPGRAKDAPRPAGRWTGLLLLGLAAAALAAGCTAALPRQRTTFAILAGVYYSAQPGAQVEAAMVEDSETLLRKAIADLNAAKDLDFVVLGGDLLAQADALSLDRARAILADLRAPYYMVLGEHDGAPPQAAPASPASAAGPSPAAGPLPAVVSRSALVWAFQGHGFAGNEAYWTHEVMPGLVLVGLDTVQPGRRGGYVDARQLEWLDRTLTAVAGKAVIVVAHHGLMPLHPLDEGAAWKSMLADNAAAVREVLDRHRNVVLVATAHRHFAEGRVSGPRIHLSSPSVGVWPLAYHLVRLTPKDMEAVWVSLADDALSRRSQERLLASPSYRSVFPAGEDGDTACIRLFGGKKMEVYPLPAIRP